MHIFLQKYYACTSTGASISSFINVILLCCLKCPHDFPLSNKSLASFIFAAKRGDPPRSGWFSAMILLWASWKKDTICEHCSIYLLHQSWWSHRMIQETLASGFRYTISEDWSLKISKPDVWLSCLWAGIDPPMYRQGTSWISCRLTTVLQGSKSSLCCILVTQ